MRAEFEYVANWRSIRKTANGKIIEDTIYCVCTAADPTGNLVEKNEFGENYWEKYGNIYQYLEKNVATGEIEKKILKEIESRKKIEKDFEEEIILAENFKNQTTGPGREE